MEGIKIGRGLQVLVLAFLITHFGLSVMAQEGNPKNRGEETHWGESREGFSMTIILAKKEVDAGMPVFVTVSVKNVSTEDLRLVETNPKADFTFVIKDHEGKQVNELEYQKKLHEYQEILRRKVAMVSAGQQVDYRFNLSRRFDMSLEGTYTVQAHRQVLKLKGQGTVLLSSNVETVIIR